MLTKLQTSIIVGLAFGISLLLLAVRQEQLTMIAISATLGVTTTVVYGIVVLFALFAWPWRSFRGWLVKRPDLRGSWRAVLHSDWKDPDTGEGIPPVEAYVAIRQTLTTLSVRLFTDKSRSVSIAYAIEAEPDGVFALSAVYRNSPKIEYQGKESCMHLGALLFEVHEVVPQRIEGHYWTDRGTRGTVELERKNRAYYSSFEDAKKALGTLR